MDREQAGDFCRRRRAAVDEWVSLETRQPRVAVAYWYWYQKNKQEERIHQVAGSLVEAVALCQEEELRIKEGRPRPSPAPVVDDSYTFCPGCGCSMPTLNRTCSGCGYGFP